MKNKVYKALLFLVSVITLSASCPIVYASETATSVIDNSTETQATSVSTSEIDTTSSSSEISSDNVESTEDASSYNTTVEEASNYSAIDIGNTVNDLVNAKIKADEIKDSVIEEAEKGHIPFVNGEKVSEIVSIKEEIESKKAELNQEVSETKKAVIEDVTADVVTTTSSAVKAKKQTLFSTIKSVLSKRITLKSFNTAFTVTPNSSNSDSDGSEASSSTTVTLANAIASRVNDSSNQNALEAEEANAEETSILEESDEVADDAVFIEEETTPLSSEEATLSPKDTALISLTASGVVLAIIGLGAFIKNKRQSKRVKG